MYDLYGDGIHDDTLAIQEMIDSGACEVCLPAPKVCYIISKSLELPSNFRLCLPRFAEIKLAKDSNCVMLKNKTTDNPAQRTDSKLFSYINQYSPDYECKNIEVCGGIWNCNNKEQLENPIISRSTQPDSYNGFGFLFYNVKNLIIKDLTMRDPVTFAITIDKTSYFTVQNIEFDFNYGHPFACNMDGVHVNGNSHFGRITNLQGACYDDLVALNADEGSDGPISNIDVSGIYAEDCHSAVRLLTRNNPFKNVHISDVHGTYFQYCIGVTKYYDGELTGYYDGITIDNVYASKAVRLPVYFHAPDSYIYPIVYVEGGQNINNLKITNLHRREYINPVETIYIGKGTVVNNMILDNITTENHTESGEMQVFVNEGVVKNMTATNIFAEGEKVDI